MAVRNRLVQIISEKCLTQSEIVRRLKMLDNDGTVTRATISNIVREVHVPSLDLAFRISIVLDKELTEVFYYEKDNSDK